MPMSDGEHVALTTLMSFTGTATELDDQLPNAIASFVASHLELKNALARAREEMDAAAKAAPEEARNNAKNNKRPAKRPVKTAEPAAREESKKEPEPARLPGLFDIAADATPSPTTSVVVSRRGRPRDCVASHPASGAAAGKGGDSRGTADLMFKENLPMTPDDRGSVTFVDMVLVLLEDQFPWLTTGSHDAVSGADTVDQLIKLHASLLRQPTARGRYSPSARA
jgi:ribosomal protein L12E/L44/L45/RPP1/RPP2